MRAAQNASDCQRGDRGNQMNNGVPPTTHMPMTRNDVDVLAAAVQLDMMLVDIILARRVRLRRTTKKQGQSCQAYFNGSEAPPHLHLEANPA